ncbi:MAG: peptidase [Burkholderiaceae bacterium]|nr:peptidase [Burkholderiaceae bacterium]
MPAAARQTSRPADSIQCFKPGRHVALSGAMLEFAAADLEATARAYDPAKHEAPLVVGHPATDAPAYGWVGALAHEDGALEAKPRQVNAEFAEMVNDGAFKKVSAAFWSPDAPGNPVPGVFYLRHVGFLGAAAPAVQGLRTPQFAGGDEGVVMFASEWDDVNNATLWRMLRDWLLGKFGQDEADRAVPAYLVASVEQGAQQELNEALNTTESASAAPAFAQPKTETATVTPAEAAALEAENTRLRQQLADQAAANRKARLDAAHADTVAFADGLVASTQLAADERELVVAMLDALAAHAEDTGAVLQFAAGDKQVPVLPAMRALLGKLPKRVELGRVATLDAAGAGAGEASLIGSAAERKRAITAMFPDLAATTA